MDQQGVIRRPWPPLYAVLSLPGGVGGGFLAVAMGYRMSQEGIPVGAIAGVISLSVLPWTWKIFGGPVLDLVLTPRIWQAIATVAVAASLLAFAMAPTTALPLLSVLSLLSGTATVLNTVAVNNIVAATEPEEARAGLGGWVLTGGLGGKGLGGGAGLWLMQHDGLLASTVVLAVVSMTGILPLLAIRTAPPVRAATLKAEVRGLVREVFVTEPAAQRHASLLASLVAGHEFPVHLVSARAAQALSDTVTPAGLVAVCDIPATRLEDVLAGSPRLIAVAVEISEPGNAGTIIRIADAMGAASVILAGHGVDLRKLIAMTVGGGGHVRVGLEDAPLGTEMRNLDWVRSAAALIAASGGTLSSPAEIRRQL